MKEINVKVIHSLALMMHLVRSGFDVLKVEDAYPKYGEEKSQFKVFMFEDTAELKEYMIAFSR